jgi:hypothetical protein
LPTEAGRFPICKIHVEIACGVSLDFGSSSVSADPVREDPGGSDLMLGEQAGSLPPGRTEKHRAGFPGKPEAGWVRWHSANLFPYTKSPANYP